LREDYCFKYLPFPFESYCHDTCIANPISCPTGCYCTEENKLY